MIDARNLTVGYGKTAAIRDISWQARVGEYWAVLGCNGTGKTALMKTLVGLLPPMAGTLRVDDQRVGYVPQVDDVNPALPTTVWEFVSLGLAGLRLTYADRRSRVDSVLAVTHVPGTRSLWRLSGGERQRVVLARAIVSYPTLLVLDEPTSKLDARSRAEFHAVLGDLRDKLPMIVVSVFHDVREALNVATHLAIVTQGRASFGTTAAQRQSAAFATNFGA